MLELLSIVPTLSVIKTWEERILPIDFYPINNDRSITRLPPLGRNLILHPSI